MMSKKISKAVIPAAGLGSRFLPATKATPKEMLPIIDKPAIQYIVEEVVAAGIEEVLIITGRNKDSIQDHFDYSPELERVLLEKEKDEEYQKLREIADLARIFFVRQKEPRGLGHAVLCAENFVRDEDFAVLLGDDIVYHSIPGIKQLIEAYQEKGSTILGVQEVDFSQVNKYGIVDPEGGMGSFTKVKGLVEKPSRQNAPSRLAVLGRYIINSEIFSFLKKTPPGAGGEIQLTDALEQLAQCQEVWAYQFEGRRYDVGDKQGYLEATVEYALRREDLGDSFRDFLKKYLE